MYIDLEMIFLNNVFNTIFMLYNNYLKLFYRKKEIKILFTLFVIFNLILK